MAWLHAVIDVPEDQLVASASFWGQAFAWPPGPAWSGHPALRSFEPTTGSAYVHLQQVDGPPRVHLDVEVEDVASSVIRAQALGARPVAAHDRWRTMRSPGGLPSRRLRDPAGRSCGTRRACVSASPTTHRRPSSRATSRDPGRRKRTPIVLKPL